MRRLINEHVALEAAALFNYYRRRLWQKLTPQQEQ
jgi:hypothetical protein